MLWDFHNWVSERYVSLEDYENRMLQCATGIAAQLNLNYDHLCALNLCTIIQGKADSADGSESIYVTDSVRPVTPAQTPAAQSSTKNSRDLR